MQNWKEEIFIFTSVYSYGRFQEGEKEWQSQGLNPYSNVWQMTITISSRNVSTNKSSVGKNI